MNRSGCNRRVAFRDAELMQIGNDIAGCIKPFNRRALLGVHLEIPRMVAAGAERFRKLRMHSAPECRV